MRPQLSDGSWQELSSTERTECKTALWKQYESSLAEDLRVAKSHFLELADLVAPHTQKSYGALDSYAEQNGRKPAEELRRYCDELREHAASLLELSLLPTDASDRQAQQAAGAAVRAHADALRPKVTEVELFIKRDLSTHVPSCLDAEPDDATATCPEHCRACAFGTDSGDAAREEEPAKDECEEEAGE